MTDTTSDGAVFKAKLVALIPRMRAFARSLCKDPTYADDLAQEALAKAWASRAGFQIGTNLKAWTFMILRNQFYSEGRRAWRSTPLDREVAEQTLVATNRPDDGVELDELRRALVLLPDDQREALILIGAGGLSYEEAAEICGVAIGTVKIRVNRARDRLACIIVTGGIPADDIRPSGAIASIFHTLNTYQLPRCA